MGIIIGDKKYWERGIGTEAMKLLIEWAFNNLHLNEINLGVLSVNKSAIRMYRKLGFKIRKIEKQSGMYDKIFMYIKK